MAANDRQEPVNANATYSKRRRMQFLLEQSSAVKAAEAALINATCSDEWINDTAKDWWIEETLGLWASELLALERRLFRQPNQAANGSALEPPIDGANPSLDGVSWSSDS